MIIGAGAAGLHCAGIAGQRGARVLLIDHAAKVAEKIRISGGGRCNFTNRDATPANFLSANPHFCRSALARYTPADFIALVRAPRHRLAREAQGPAVLRRLGRADIIAMLLRECDAGGVTRWQPCAVRGGARTADGGFELDTDRGTGARARSSSSPPAACRSRRSAPPTSATGWRAQFGHRIVEPRPGAGAADLRRRDLGALRAAGRRCRCEVAIDTGSGKAARPIRRRPAVHPPRPERPGGAADLELLAARRSRCASTSRPGTTSAGAAAPAKQRLAAASSATSWPSCCRSAWPRPGCASAAALADRPMPEMRDRDLRGLAARCSAGTLAPGGTEGYRKAEVTRRRRRHPRAELADAWRAGACPGLYFIGEVVDVTGWLGGYNFQWAWASAAACAPAWPTAAAPSSCPLTAGLPAPDCLAIIAVFAGKPRRDCDSRPAGTPDPLTRCNRQHRAQLQGFTRYMTTIRVKENEPFDVALRRFKRTIEKLGLLTDLRAREFYEKPTAERKRKKAAAVKRHFKRVRSMQLPKKLY